MTIEDSSSHRGQEIGPTLERARVERGFSLQQVEEATRIRAKYLHDLERENFDVLPAVYVLGSLKTYADYLGLDGEALVRELRSRQAPQQEEPDQEDEDRMGGGFLATLGVLLGFGGQGNAEDEAPATERGHGSRVYWGLGAVLILILTVAFVSSLGGGDQPAVSQVREPTIPGAPSRIALAGDLQDEGETERDQGAGSTADSPQKRAKPRDEGDEKREKARGDTGAEEDTGDGEINIPMPTTGSTGVSSAALAARTLASTSTPASASASSTATAAPATEPASEPATAAPEATTPVVVDPDASAGPTASESAPPEPASSAPGTASASSGASDGSGPRQAEGEGLDASELSDDIFDEVEDATSLGQ